MKRLSYNFLVRIFALVVCFSVGVTVLVPQQFATAQEIQSIQGVPTYQYIKTIEPEVVSYDPTGEFIFPGVIDASEHISNPLGRYYMYYAPHDAPAGICLAYADNIEGPYTEYSIINIGNYTFNTAGIKQFRLVVTGKDSNSQGYSLGNDMILVTRN